MLWTIGKLREFPTMMVFGTFEVQPNREPKVKFRIAAVLSRTEISSEVSLQNSVTSKPLGGYNRMSNG
jgi:hypothetical protein